MEIFYGIILLNEQWTISVIAESVWDPLSTTQTSRLVNVISKLGRDYPCIQANNKATQVGAPVTWLFQSKTSYLRQYFSV